MNKKILNEVKRNRELMGINESELDEQGFLRGVRDGIKKGFQKGREAIKNTVDNIKDKLDGDEELEVKKYNNTPIDEIIQDVKDMNKSKGKIDVNGETLYFGVGETMDRETAKKKARNNAEIAAAEDLRTGNEDFNVREFVTKVSRLTQAEDNDYIYYILISNSNVD